jgi:hypothetical protein
MVRSNWVTSAVVAVTSVQPTSEKRTVWQLTGSPAALGATVLGTAVLAAASFATAARVTSVIISAQTTHGSTVAKRAAGCLGGLTTRPVGRHD